MNLGALPPAFAGLEPEDSREAAAYLQPFSLESGDLLMQRGEEDFTLAFVVQGSLSFLDGEIRVGSAISRDMIGEVELFGQMARTVTVVASAPTHLLVLAHEHWLELCERGSPVVYNIERAAHRRLTERLRYLTEGISERSDGSRATPEGPRKGLIGRLSSLLGVGRPPPIAAATVLQQSVLFNWADLGLLQEIASRFQPERIPSGTLVCRKGEASEKGYLIAEGQAEMVVGAEVVAQLGPGHAFGDASLAQNAPQIANCICRSDLVALSITREQYGELFGLNDPVGSVFRQSMSRNLILQLLSAQRQLVELERKATEKVEETLRGSPVSTIWRG